MKCDERQPICFHCEVSRRECVGWASKFLVGYQPPSTVVNPSVSCSALKFKKPLSTVPESYRNPQPKAEKRVVPHGKSPGVIIDDTRLDDVLVPGVYCPTFLAPFPLSPTERLASRVVDMIQNGSTNRFNVFYFGSYFEELPTIIGRNVCLDTAVECFLLAQQRLGRQESQDVQGSNELLRHYGKALKLLRTELNAPQPQRRTESLAVAVILLASELIDDSLSPHSPFSHADGACAILRACGPDGFNSKFELQLFYSLVPTAVSKCLEQDTECFLSTPDWAALLDRIPAQWTVTRIEARILHTYTKMPAFMQATRKWRHSSFTDIPGDVLIDILCFKQQLIELGRETAEILRNSGLMLELPRGPRNPGPTSYYRFRDVRLADSLSVLFRMVILVARGLSQLHLLQPFDWEWASSAALQLCMSVGHRNIHTPVEAFFDSLVLRIARLASSQDLGDWIENRLQQVDLWMGSALKNAVHQFESWMEIEAVVMP